MPSLQDRKRKLQIPKKSPDVPVDPDSGSARFIQDYARRPGTLTVSDLRILEAQIRLDLRRPSPAARWSAP